MPVPTDVDVVRPVGHVLEGPRGRRALAAGHVAIVPAKHRRHLVLRAVPPAGLLVARVEVAVIQDGRGDQRPDVRQPVALEQGDFELGHLRQGEDRLQLVAGEVQSAHLPHAAQGVGAAQLVARCAEEVQPGDQLDVCQVVRPDIRPVEDEVAQPAQADLCAGVGLVGPGRTRPDRIEVPPEEVVRKVQYRQVGGILDAGEVRDPQPGEVQPDDGVHLATVHGQGEVRLPAYLEDRYVELLGDRPYQRRIDEHVVEDRVDLHPRVADEPVGRVGTTHVLVLGEITNLDRLGEEHVLAALAVQVVEVVAADDDVVTVAAVDLVEVARVACPPLERRVDLHGDLHRPRLPRAGVVDPQVVPPGLEPSHIGGLQALVHQAAVVVEDVHDHAVLPLEPQPGGLVGVRVRPIDLEPQVRIGRHPHRHQLVALLDVAYDLAGKVDCDRLRDAVGRRDGERVGGRAGDEAVPHRHYTVALLVEQLDRYEPAVLGEVHDRCGRVALHGP